MRWSNRQRVYDASGLKYSITNDQFPDENLVILAYENCRVINETVHVNHENARVINHKNARFLNAQSLPDRYVRALIGNSGPNQAEDSSEP